MTTQLGQRNTLNEPFNEVGFKQLIEGLVEHEFYDETKQISYHSDVIKSVENIGTFQNNRFHNILIINHVSKIGNRIKLATETFKVMSSNNIDSALVAYFSDKEKLWRISLVTLSFEENKTGKIKKIFSNPRRYSYILGPSARTVTPNRYLVSKGIATNFDDLLSRFSVEVVNNEFYKEIAKLYDELVGTDDRPGILKYPGEGDVLHEFAVRIIGRIIFCWFLREKRSNKGTPLIPHEILSRESANKQNYYINVLAPLFFEVLNKHIESREETFRQNEYLSIPYLNGGLFNPDHDDYYQYDRDSGIAESGSVDVPDAWLRKFFDLLELFNFTVDENTSYDIELSIDPEMLGRIFENLLARINPETGEMVRKSTGSYYTPREIVDHMVDESLKNYLKKDTGINEDKLAALVSYDLMDDEAFPLNDLEKNKITDSLSSARILDPACGSGAYPIGILQKIVYILQRVDPESRKWIDKQLYGAGPELKRHLEKEFENKNFNYLRKLGVIRESIYGIDIQPIATEISRLRCFLTLIVDQSVDDHESNRGIEPLPNLDFKFVTANSLIGLNLDKDNRFDQTDLFEDTTGISELKRLRNEYFSSHNSERERLKLQFAQRQNKMLQDMILHHSHGFSQITQKLSTWNPFSHQTTNWFDPEWMFGINDGFDIVIGNPPYGLLNKKQNQKLGHLVSDEELSFYKHSTKYKAASGGVINAYRLFIVQSIDLLRENGFFVEIFPLAFTADVSASNLRRHIFDSYSILGIDSFPERDDPHKRVFESAKMSVCILYLVKTKSAKDKTFYVRINRDKYVDLNSPRVHMTYQDVESIDSQNLTIPLLHKSDLDVIRKIYNNSHKLSDFGHCYTGEIDLTFGKKYLTDNTEDAQFIKGAIIDRFTIKDSMSQGEIKFLDKSEYLKENTGKKASHYKQTRIVMQAITGVNEKIRIKSTIIESGVFCGNSVNYIVLKDNRLDINFLLGILNSKVVNFVFKKFSTNSNVNGYEVDNLPIPNKFTNQSYLIELVNRILTNIKSGYDEVKDVDEEVNQIIYNLYDLTEQQISIIENGE